MSRAALSQLVTPSRRSVLVLATVVAVAAAGPLLSAQPAARPAVAPSSRIDHQILMIDAGDPNRPAFLQFNEGFLRRVRADSSARVTVYREHHAPNEGGGLTGFDALPVAFWATRYARTPLDLIVAGGTEELELAIRLRARLGRPTPIVYRASPSDGPAVLARAAATPLATGLIDPLLVRPVVEDLVHLRPTLRHLLVIHQGQGNLPVIEAEAAMAQPGITVTTWYAPPLDALRDSVRRLPADAAVLYVAVFRDGDGHLWTPADYLEAFADASAQPVLGLYRNLVGRGIIGGRVIDPSQSGERMADRALAVLRDPMLAERRQVDMSSGWRPTYDWSGLRRHDLDLRRLPVEAEIIGRPVPLWRSHPFAFWAVSLLLLLQTMSILALGSNRRATQHAKRELSALTRRLQRTQESEQARLARELHDTLAQDLMSQALDLQRYAPDAAAPNHPPFAERLRHAVTRLDAITHELHPSALQMLDLRAAVHQLVTDFRSRTNIEVSFSERGLDRSVAEEVRAAVFRIVQEALANVRRHAEATQVAVLIDRNDTTLTVTVRDDGIGFDPTHRSLARLGLLGMRERAAAIDGRLTIDSTPGDGTSITLTVPLPTHR